MTESWSPTQIDKESTVPQNQLPPRQDAGIPQIEECDQTPVSFIDFKVTILIEYWTTKDSLFLTDAPKDRENDSSTNNPNAALRLNWAGWDIKAQAFARCSEGLAILPEPIV